MKLGIIIIGDEILLGRVTDTNSGLIARAFSANGWEVTSVRTVGDNANDIKDAIAASMAINDLTISTGGLGPTRDDITKPVLTEIFGGTLVENLDVRTNVERIFAQRGLKMNDLTLHQAWVPSSCVVIQNIYGTAPLMWFEKDAHVLVAMPGVPFETRGMLPVVAENVLKHFGQADLIMHREFTVSGISESALAEQLAAFEDSLPHGFKLAYLPAAGEIVLRLDGAQGADTDVFEHYADALADAIGCFLVGVGKILPAEMALHALRKRGWTLATAESCTGGNIAHSITAIAGCSDTYSGSVVSYTNDIKARVLGVPQDVLDSVGAVSQETVKYMAQGVRRVCNADCAVATSGIAGPGGEVDGKPVGTVWIAAATPERAIEAVYHFVGDRQAVIDRASATALTLLTKLIVEK